MPMYDDDYSDGFSYRNEFQVAFSKAQQEANLKDETVKARGLLVGDVEAVLMLTIPRYCPYTDAILGNDTTIQEIFTDIGAAEAALLAKNEDECDEVYHYLIRRHTPDALKSYNLVDEGDIPF